MMKEGFRPYIVFFFLYFFLLTSSLQLAHHHAPCVCMYIESKYMAKSITSTHVSLLLLLLLLLLLSDPLIPLVLFFIFMQ